VDAGGRETAASGPRAASADADPQVAGLSAPTAGAGDGSGDEAEGGAGEELEGDAAGAPEPLPLGGALVAATRICPREVWLMAHAIQPDEDDPHLFYGRFLHGRAYARERRDVQWAGNRLDLIQARPGGELVVLEVKKIDRAAEAARLQLAHYLLSLEESGTTARGELRFPEQKQAEALELDDRWRQEVREARERAREIARQPEPPSPRRIRWCAHCAYAEFCWA
jgi:CRISPR-associated exonuclease Cas4